MSIRVVAKTLTRSFDFSMIFLSAFNKRSRVSIFEFVQGILANRCLKIYIGELIEEFLAFPKAQTR